MSSLKCRSNKSQPLWSLLREIYVLVETQEFVFSLRIPSGSSQTASEQKHLNSPCSCTQAHLQSPITSPGVIFPATSTAHLAANRSCIKRLAAIHRFLLRMPPYRYSAPLCFARHCSPDHKPHIVTFVACLRTELSAVLFKPLHY